LVVPGDKQSLVEVKQASGVTSQAILTHGGLLYVSESIGDANKNRQIDNFRVGTYGQIYPKLKLVDSVSSWVPGRFVVVGYYV